MERSGPRWPERLYNPFLFFVVDFTIINLYVSFIQQDRFQRESRERRSQIIGNHNYSYEKVPKASLKREKVSLLEKFRWMLEYNCIRSSQLLLFTMSTFVIIQSLFKSIVFLSADRDNESWQVWIRYLESIYFCDILRNFKRYKLLHRLRGIVLMSHLVTKIISVKNLIKESELNRYEYKKISSIQIDVGLLTKFSGTFKDWWNLLRECCWHKCDLESREAQQYQRYLKRLNQSTKSLDRVDRIYYFNLIDFSPCFRKQPIFLRPDNGGSSFKRYNSKKGLFTLPDAHVPIPNYRIDPKHFFWFLLIAVDGVIGIILIPVSTVGIVWYSEIKPLGFDIQDSSTYLNTLIAVFSSLQTLFNLSECLLLVVLLAIDAAHVGLIGYSGLVFRSRGDRVNNLLRILIKKFRSYQRNFLDLRSNNLQSYDHEKINNLKSSIGFVEIENFNEDLSFILDMIDILRIELEDLKKFFTVHLNLYAIYGAIGIAYSVAAMSQPNSIEELIFGSTVGAASCFPLLFSVFLGALSEDVVSETA